MLLAWRVSGVMSAYTRSSSSRTFRKLRQNDHAAGPRTTARPRMVSVNTPLATLVTISNQPRCAATVFMTNVSGSAAGAACSSHAPERVMSSVIGALVCKGKASDHGHATDHGNEGQADTLLDAGEPSRQPSRP